MQWLTEALRNPDFASQPVEVRAQELCAGCEAVFCAWNKLLPALLQAPSVGLSASGRKSLQHVFERMDKVSLRHHKFTGCKRFKTMFHPQRKTGRISYADFKGYAGSSGVQTLSEDELKSIFGDFSQIEVMGLHKRGGAANQAPDPACQTC